ncbi:MULTISPECIES: carboxymuconolactone decarboxylase family protein [unclassified Dehalobacter]|jgi:Uncharacterized homolog of gamma-carboxymuconolactone decarboxylase subunit|uniref:carboxymuconolactone decarboxylase family protein n=1 Tax=unclassified Dehalobacter TaxID=2635733 RepID=UPI00028AF66A|nr:MULTISPECIES: carboxymuconolactone decarboxylase family protein [unclassified Dehalobacter]AFV01159.1 gamma-carboxymuconolactone decarboxylase subunit-like protein [Dehalobacter sp. DCA]AFV04202.1 gamma-carboxymuconolactone decarboxylase subunit-like protein [Dehalobacter sp. CF]
MKKMYEEYFPEYAEKLGELDAQLFGKGKLDLKTIHYICLALAIRGRSKPCVIKHFKGAKEAGATIEDLTSVIALTMREAAGQDDDWTHDVLGDWNKL